MTSIARVALPSGTITTALAAAAIPAAGWAAHNVVWHRRLADASRDKLTGALRRDAWEPRIQRFITRYGDNALLLICDVDHFKTFNDDFGHHVGDLVLKSTASRLMEWAGSRGIVGRMGGDGGDEFVVGAWVGAGRRSLRLDQLNRALREPVDTGDGPAVDVAVSIGAAAPDVIGTRDRERLQRAADVAMYAGKHTGQPVLATRAHADVATINGRRPGRIGTHAGPEAA
ncbi:GGDEF domain-containing protein [Streptomyces sp. NPDC058470]|uniref:GGDEF domain-containing protein n=1 Tax=Streptomyces sp. NPDC058470 TaxID=3346515 RepID=UPI0036581DFE